jgi:hypothetical protein
MPALNTTDHGYLCLQLQDLVLIDLGGQGYTIYGTDNRLCDDWYNDKHQL